MTVENFIDLLPRLYKKETDAIIAILDPDLCEKDYESKKLYLDVSDIKCYISYIITKLSSYNIVFQDLSDEYKEKLIYFVKAVAAISIKAYQELANKMKNLIHDMTMYLVDKESNTRYYCYNGKTFSEKDIILCYKVKELYGIVKDDFMGEFTKSFKSADEFIKYLNSKEEYRYYLK